MGVILSAGGSLGWCRDKVVAPRPSCCAAQGLDPFAVLLEQALALPPGADGAAVPALPRRRALAAHGPARPRRLGRASASRTTGGIWSAPLIEGVGLRLADCLERMRALGLEPASLALVGGGARNPAWRRILASQLRVELTTAVGGGGGAGAGGGDPGKGGGRPRSGSRRGDPADRAAGWGEDGARRSAGPILSRAARAVPAALPGAQGDRALRLTDAPTRPAYGAAPAGRSRPGPRVRP